MSINNNTVYPKAYIIALGDLIEGFTFYGPFKDHNEAFVWISDNVHVGTVCKIMKISDVRNDL